MIPGPAQVQGQLSKGLETLNVCRQKRAKQVSHAFSSFLFLRISRFQSEGNNQGMRMAGDYEIFVGRDDPHRARTMWGTDRIRMRRIPSRIEHARGPREPGDDRPQPVA